MQVYCRAVDSRIIFASHRMFPKVQKDVIPAIVVHEFMRECDARYVGRTYQRLVATTRAPSNQERY